MAKSESKQDVGAWSAVGLAARGYAKCPNCPRSFKNLDAHLAMESEGLIGKDGKRTDREARVAATLRFRSNGTTATEAFKDAEAREAAIASALEAVPAAKPAAVKKSRKGAKVAAPTAAA